MSEYRVRGQCPTCGHLVHVTRLACSRCSTALEGEFGLTRFDLLTDQQMEFLELFLKARGNIREVERILGLSYPAVRARLDHVLKALDLESGTSSDLEESRRLDVLEAVKRGDLSVQSAVEQLRGNK